MDDKSSVTAVGPDDTRKNWETPTLIVEDVRSITHGGSNPTPSPVHPPDDTWYS
jgi:hypothetical protein